MQGGANCERLLLSFFCLRFGLSAGGSDHIVALLLFLAESHSFDLEDLSLYDLHILNGDSEKIKDLALGYQFWMKEDVAVSDLFFCHKSQYRNKGDIGMIQLLVDEPSDHLLHFPRGYLDIEHRTGFLYEWAHGNSLLSDVISSVQNQVFSSIMGIKSQTA